MSTPPRRAILAANCRLLERAQPELARGLLDIPLEAIEKLEAVGLPSSEPASIQTFATQAVAVVSDDAMVLVGLAPPEVLLAVRRMLPADRALIVVEPSLELAVRLLSQVDYSPVLEKPNTGMVLAGEDRDLAAQLEGLFFSWGIRSVNVISHSMRQLGNDVVQLISGMLRTTLLNVNVAAANGAKYGRQTIENLCANVPATLKSRDITALKDRYKGCEAVIIGAGPSLDDHEELLRILQPRALVIAVDAALPCLSRMGIVPDVVVTIDVIANKAELFANHYAKDALLVALASCHPEIASAWIGPTVFVSDTHPLAMLLGSKTKGMAGFGPMGNVAQLAYHTALYLGCKRATLVGVDLALKGSDQLYATGVEHTGADGSGVPENLKNHIITAKANDGSDINTVENMVVYAHTLGAMLSADCPARTVSASGLRIPGLSYVPAAAVAGEAPMAEVTRPVPTSKPDDALFRERRAALRKILGELQAELRAFAADGLELSQLADELKRLVELGEITPEEGLERLKPKLEAYARHRDMNFLVRPLQPAVLFETNRMVRETESLEDEILRTGTRILAKSASALDASTIAEHIADQLVGVLCKLRD